jgi:hypothetical protein
MTAVITTAATITTVTAAMVITTAITLIQTAAVVAMMLLPTMTVHPEDQVFSEDCSEAIMTIIKEDYIQ